VSNKTKRRNRLSPLTNGHIAPVAAPAPAALLKLDIGAGPNCKEGFEGVDIFPFDGKVKHVLDVVWKPQRIPGLINPYTNKDAVLLPSGFAKWPWADGSVAEIHASHFLEHLTNLNDKWERVHFFNEVYRVLGPASYDAAGKPVTGMATITIPYWCSHRYFGDPTHKECFSEMALWYFEQNCRMNNAPHTDIQYNPNGYSCDFNFLQWYNVHPEIALKNTEGAQFALRFYREAAQDLVFVIWKRG